MISVRGSVDLRQTNTVFDFAQLSDDAFLCVIDCLVKNARVAGLTDCKALLCAHRSIEQILSPWWSHLLFRYFPYSYELQSGLSEKKSLFHSAKISGNIKKGNCFYEAIGLSYITYPRVFNDMEWQLRENCALTICDGRLLHVGFGDHADFSQKSTTVDVHYFGEGFDLKKANKSTRFNRDDIVSVFVSGNYIYFGSCNGEIVIVDYENSRVVDTICCHKCLINNIHVYQGHICYSDYKKKCLNIFHSFDGKIYTKSIPFKYKIIALESDENNFYCITCDGSVATVDLKEGTVTRIQSLKTSVSGKPLLKDGFLYTFHKQSLSVFDLAKDAMHYSHQFKGQVCGLGVYRDYVFISVLNEGIIALDRNTGVYVSTICELDNYTVTGIFKFYNDVLYSYTSEGEILTVDLNRLGLSEFEKKLGSAARGFRLSFRPVFAVSGPNRRFL